jgi:peptidoglycan/LPS O-acetylase OafA/YrhL
VVSHTVEGKPARVPQIQVLRVLTVAWIFLFHAWSVVPEVGDAGVLGAALSRIASAGFMGAILFNIITGYVLAWPHLGPQKRPPLSYVRFLRQRFFRICQNYYLALLLWTGIAWIFSSGGGSGPTLFSFVAHLFFVHTLSPTAFFDIVPAYWWLGPLAQFYLLFPLLLRLFERVGPGRVCLLLCAVCWGGWVPFERFTESHPGSVWALVNYMAFFNLPTRLPEFALGMWLAAAWTPRLASTSAARSQAPQPQILSPPFIAFLVGAVLFALLAEAVPSWSRGPLHHIHLVASCLVVLVGVLVWPRTARVGEVRWVAAVAVASYSIYLVHQPLLGYGHQLLQGIVTPLQKFCVLVIGCGILSYALARAMDWLIDRLGKARGRRGKGRNG